MKLYAGGCFLVGSPTRHEACWAAIGEAYNLAMATNASALSERQKQFLERVRATLTGFAREHGADLTSDAVEIEFPSASLDANGRPRFSMALPPSLIINDLGAAHVFYHDVAGRGFEFPTRRFIDLHMRSDDVFVDVGAHWGVHSLTAASLRPGQVSVLAMEPHPDNSRRFRSWIDRNQLHADIELIPTAIGDREGAARMWVSASSMAHHLRETASEAGMTAIEVAMTTLDHVLHDRPHLRWRRFILKIDVEGHEAEVLHGARHLFSTEDVVAVLWEKATFYETGLQAQRDGAVLDFLSSRGFAHFRMEDEHRGGRLIPLAGSNWSGNVFSLARGFEPNVRYE